MHDSARFYVAQFSSNDPLTVFELGSLNINGGVRGMFPNADYTGIDLVAGEGVDEVADGATWAPGRTADLVVCCEVFEHTTDWPLIVDNICRNLLRPGGRVVLTMAGPGRDPHSAVDGGPVRAGEFYANVPPDELYTRLAQNDMVAVQIDVLGPDVRATAVR